MRIKITASEYDSNPIVFNGEYAAEVAAVFAKARIYDKEGYGDTARYKLSEKSHIHIEYVADDAFEPVPRIVEEALKTAEKHRSDWRTEYNARNKAEKELGELKAAMAALQASTVCHRAEPEAPTQPQDDDFPL